MQLLEALARADMPMAVGTSMTRKEALHHLNHCEVEHFFRSVAARDDVARGKPHPDVHLKAMSALGFEVSDCSDPRRFLQRRSRGARHRRHGDHGAGCRGADAGDRGALHAGGRRPASGRGDRSVEFMIATARRAGCRRREDHGEGPCCKSFSIKTCPAATCRSPT